MAVLGVSRATGIRPPLCCAEGVNPSARFRVRCFPLRRAELRISTRPGQNRWRVACAGVDCASEWRRECRELRVEIHELQNALADAWMQDEMSLLELEKLVSSLVAVCARPPDQAGDGDSLSVPSSAVVRKEDEAYANATPGQEGVDDIHKSAVRVSELRSEELRANQEGLSTLRRLKTLNVHEYVHNALRESHLRSWLKSRGIAE